MTSKKPQNILVTGANGFVGQALVARLLPGGDHLFLVSRNKKFKCPGATVLYGDLSDDKFCKKVLKDVDVVYYLAGFRKNIFVHTTQPFEALVGNVLPLLSFLKSVKGSSVRKIIYTSSTVVEYADMSEEKIDGYVRGKYINELILKTFTKETGVDVKIVRYAAVYGPGNDFTPETANIIPAVVVKVKEAKDEIVIWGKGSRKLQFVYIDDVADTLVRVQRISGDFFVVGHSQSISVLDLVKKIMVLMDKKLKICKDLSKPDKPTKLTTFHKTLKAKIGLDKGLRETIAHYKKYHVA